MNKISILHIAEDTTVDGPGLRTSIYAAGCPHHCAGCHNPQSWNFRNGSLWTMDALMAKIKQSEFANVTFTGGDPLLQPAGFTELARRIRRETGKTIWCYTGYTGEEVMASDALSQILPYIDVLVDGPYLEAFRDESLLFRGSRNQRLIEVAPSLAAKQFIPWKHDTGARNFIASENTDGNRNGRFAED